MPRSRNALRCTRLRIGAPSCRTPRLLLAVTVAGCGGGETAAGGKSEAAQEAVVTTGVTNLDEWCGAVREVGAVLDGAALDAPQELHRSTPTSSP